MKKTLLLLGLFLLTGIALSQVPQTLSYQGVLTDQNGLIVPDNNYSITFKLYDVLSGGTALWEETQTSPVFKGLFSVVLGTVVPVNLSFSNQYYLGISVGGNPELQPRIMLTSAGYSLISRSVIDNSITTSKILDGAITQAKLATGLSLPPGGTAGGDLSGSFPNPVVNKIQGRTLSGTAPTSGQILSWNGTQWAPTTPSSGMGGSGSTGYLPKFTAGNTIGNSILIEDAGKLGIGRTSAAYPLDIGNATTLADNFVRVNASARAGIFFSNGTTYGGLFYIHSGNFLQFNTQSPTGYGERMRITDIGMLGVGTTTPLGKIHAETHGRYAGYFTSDSLSVSTYPIFAEFTGTGGYDAKAVYGKGTPADGYGYGGYFLGGYRGVYGGSTAGAYNGSTFGVAGYASGTAGSRYGVYGTATGGTTNFGVFASGDIGYTGNLIHAADLKLQQSITPLTKGILDKVKLLEPKLYSFTSDSKYSNMNLPIGMHYGLTAQDLEKVFPELVKDAVHPSAKETSGERGGEPITYKGVVMTEMIPILIQAVKEQQQIIDDLKARLEKLENK